MKNKTTKKVNKRGKVGITKTTSSALSVTTEQPVTEISPFISIKILKE